MINRCEIEFSCTDAMHSDCGYYKTGEDGECKFMDNVNWTCHSAVAQANAMVLKLKELGIKELEEK